MKSCLALLLLFLCSTGYSQKQKVDKKNLVITAALGLASGGFDGAADGLAFHNTSNHPFWGQNSYLNKYKNHDPVQGETFRGKYLVFTTDGMHLMRFGRNLFTAGAVAIQFTGKKQKWWVYALQGCTFWAFNRVGFNLVYNRFKTN
jgi:hypothetical protein